MMRQDGFGGWVKGDVPISTEKLTKDAVAKYYLVDGRWLKMEGTRLRANEVGGPAIGWVAHPKIAGASWLAQTGRRGRSPGAGTILLGAQESSLVRVSCATGGLKTACGTRRSSTTSWAGPPTPRLRWMRKATPAHRLCARACGAADALREVERHRLAEGGHPDRAAESSLRRSRPGSSGQTSRCLPRR